MTLPLTELQPDRYFDPDRRATALALYETVADLPLICPHGHVDPALFADPDARFPDPAELLVIPDHYVFRMLYSQGVPMEAMGIPRASGRSSQTTTTCFRARRPACGSTRNWCRFSVCRRS